MTRDFPPGFDFVRSSVEPKSTRVLCAQVAQFTTMSKLHIEYGIARVSAWMVEILLN
jgi:hypothetical protein